MRSDSRVLYSPISSVVASGLLDHEVSDDPVVALGWPETSRSDRVHSCERSGPEANLCTAETAWRHGPSRSTAGVNLSPFDGFVSTMRGTGHRRGSRKQLRNAAI